jgi:hypothetical protein
MVQILSVVAIVSLIVTLASTTVAIWMEEPRAAHFLELTSSLLSWEVIAGGLAIGAVNVFQTEIKAILTKLAQGPSS